MLMRRTRLYCVEGQINDDDDESSERENSCTKRSLKYREFTEYETYNRRRRQRNNIRLILFHHFNSTFGILTVPQRLQTTPLHLQRTNLETQNFKDFSILGPRYLNLIDSTEGVLIEGG